MVTRKIPKSPGRLARLLVLLPALMLSPSCASSRIGQFDDTTLSFKNVCRIHFGHANINWWLLQGVMSNIDISPDGGSQLSGATFRVFEDGNGNGTYDAGENTKTFSSTTGPNGLTISNISLSAGDISGWNTDNISWQAEVTDSAGKLYICSQNL